MRKLKRNTVDVLPSEIQDELSDSSSLESITRSMKDERQKERDNNNNQ